MMIPFDRNWETYPTPEPEESHLPRTVRSVDLPHDDNIRYDTSPDNLSSHAGAYYPGCSAEYEKTLTVDESMQGKRISLAFDGVYHNAVVRVNDRLVHRGHYGYTAFCCNLTEFLHPGENRIRVSAANRDVPNSRWYTGTGIFRDVELLVQPPVYLPWRSTVLTTAIADGTAYVNARVPVANTTGQAAVRTVRVSIGECLSEAEIRIEAGKEGTAELRIRMDDPKMWSDREPYLYAASVELMQDGETEDSISFRYGLRTIEFSAEKGFLLNGIPTKLRGGCVHHDNGILGSASYLMAERRKVHALKASGFNAIRSAHNPASEALLQACDEYGMLVMDEAFDMWREPKMPYDNSLFFEHTWREDLEGMIRRDRNHACVIMYSTGNEIPERDGHSGGNEWAEKLANECRRLDPSRPVIHALNNVAPEGNVNGIEANLLGEQDYFLTATEAFARPLDIVGYNYMRDRLEKDHNVYPERILCATETVGVDIFEGWKAVEKCPWVIGDFLWTAIDYLGEVGVGRATPEPSGMGLADYPWRLSACGDLDIFGRKKPRSYYRDCVWGIASRPFIAVENPELLGKKPFIMWWGWPLVQEYWNYPGQEGKPIRVWVYSRAEEVTLMLDGEEVGRAAAGEKQAYRAAFELVYRQGELTAIEYTDGRECGRHTICTPGNGRKIVLSPDKACLDSSVDDLMFVDVQLTDENGVRVMEDGRRVNFEVSGGAVLLAAGSAAPKTTANYTSPVQTLYEGHVQAVLRVKRDSCEPVSLVCHAEGLEEAKLTVDVRPGGIRE